MALEGHNNTNMVALFSDCKPAIRVVEKLDSGTEAPRSSIETRIQAVLQLKPGKTSCKKHASRGLKGIRTSRAMRWPTR